MTGNKNSGYKQYRGPLAEWSWTRWSKRGLALKDVAKGMELPSSIISTMVGGQDRLSEYYVTKFVQWHISNEFFASGAEFQELLDVFHQCPGYQLDFMQENKLREMAKAEGIITIDELNVLLVEMDKIVRGFTDKEFEYWAAEQQQKHTQFQPLIGILRSWRRHKNFY
jgi:hypothetical protein